MRPRRRVARQCKLMQALIAHKTHHVAQIWRSVKADLPLTADRVSALNEQRLRGNNHRC